MNRLSPLKKFFLETNREVEIPFTEPGGDAHLSPGSERCIQRN